MAGDGRHYTHLREVAEIIMGQSPPGSTYNENGEGLPFFQGVKDFTYRYPTPRIFCSAPSRIALPGDILLSIRAPIGRINIANRECAIGRGLAIVRPREETDARFVEIALRHLEPTWHAIEGGGSVFGNATRKDLEGLALPWPDRASERRAIAHILGTLDDKIELNHSVNETLEGIARAIFKSWFVNFDPVRAKAEGRDPGLAEEIADLFPDSFEDSELGEIPKGWRVEKLGNVIELVYGKALKASDRRLGRIPVFGSNGQVGWHDENLASGPGIIVGRKGNPGIVTWAHTDFFTIDTTFYVRMKDGIQSLCFLFYALHDQDLALLSADSAVPGLNRNLAYMSPQIVPESKILASFDRQIEPLFSLIHSLNEESQTLATLRDTLLPKLISGELRVPEARRIVERDT